MSNLIHSNSIFATQLNSLNGSRIRLGNAGFAYAEVRGIAMPSIDSGTPCITAAFNGKVGGGTPSFTRKPGSDGLLGNNGLINKSIFDHNPYPVGLYHSPQTASGGGTTS
ncbi:MAG: hypothetical protein HXX08_01410 [Chloroflexi bacterium]|uniref:Uncharacterized protein n=1 Tax=Candidatus Chlorohelix allophototropha TaxID=3003348 RepID=A0A8T7LR53_9CHLR|nr:hypothetical protein [Chloroflexota bacterium]WJW66407.1 hypothetical protein OZ401_002203 [Chloroflexota bacterium L227-S17]